MAPVVRQQAFNTVGDHSSSCKVTFDQPTLPNSLIYVASGHHVDNEDRAPGTSITATDTSGASVTFTQIRERGINFLGGSFWYKEACPALTSLTLRVGSVVENTQVQAFEITGVNLSGSLDKVAIKVENYEDYPSSKYPNSGTTGTTSQAEELLIGTIINRYQSTTQQGFSGGLTKISDKVSKDTEADKDRTRMTVHTAVTTAVGDFSISCTLGTGRDWIAFLATFKSGVSGPARFTCDNNALTTSGTGDLTVFGPLLAQNQGNALTVTSDPLARISPSNYQYLLGGWDGLTIGAGTDYLIKSISGLEGQEVRTSDSEQARDDGALRGIDLQEVRQILFELDMGGSEEEVETLLADLYAKLVPSRDADWDLIFRHPGQPVKKIRCRPTNLIRDLDYRLTLLQEQQFALIAVDPRIYSVEETTVEVPVTTGTDATVTTTNEGNYWAYPVIYIEGPSTGADVTRIELVNATTDTTFDVQAVLQQGSLLIGDMPARVTGAPRPVVTIDGASKYGAWTFPREAFRLAPGDNDLYIRTEPAGSDITCRLVYSDTWAA